MGTPPESLGPSNGAELALPPKVGVDDCFDGRPRRPLLMGASPAMYVLTPWTTIVCSEGWSHVGGLPRRALPTGWPLEVTAEKTAGTSLI